MEVLKLQLKNLEARRFSTPLERVNINNNSTLTSVSRIDDTLAVGFVFSSSYEPNVGLIRLEGEIMLKESPEKIEEVLNEWERSGRKNLPKDIAEKVHNLVVSTCIVEATILSREVQLPPPFPTPHISFDSISGPKTPGDTQKYIR